MDLLVRVGGVGGLGEVRVEIGWCLDSDSRVRRVGWGLGVVRGEVGYEEIMGRGFCCAFGGVEWLVCLGR